MATKARPKRRSTKATPEAASGAADPRIYQDRDRTGDLLDLQVDQLCPNPFNKREMKGVAELAAAIEEVGLLQPIAHIPAKVWLEKYPETRDAVTADNVILFGEHRWRAIQHLGRATISTTLRSDLVADARLITLIENLRRAPLNPIEEAEHYRALRESDGLSYEQIAQKVGEDAEGAKSKGTIWKRVKLLDLDDAVQKALRDGEIPVSSAESLGSFDAEEQRAAVELIRQGVRPQEVKARILAKQRQPDSSPDAQIDADAASVSNGNGDEASTATDERDASDSGRLSGDAVSNGNGAAVKSTTRPASVSTGNGAAAREADERRSAAAARDEAAARLVAHLDVADPTTYDVLLRTFSIAAMAPAQQRAAQQRAIEWLRRSKHSQPDVADAGRYFTEVAEADPDVQLRAAFATALATLELRIAGRRQAWGSVERAYTKLLESEAGYEPVTDWENAQLAPAQTGTTK